MLPPATFRTRSPEIEDVKNVDPAPQDPAGGRETTDAPERNCERLSVKPMFVADNVVDVLATANSRVTTSPTPIGFVRKVLVSTGASVTKSVSEAAVPVNAPATSAVIELVVFG